MNLQISATQWAVSQLTPSALPNTTWTQPITLLANACIKQHKQQSNTLNQTSQAAQSLL